MDRNGRRSNALVANTVWIPLRTQRRPCGPPFHSYPPSPLADFSDPGPSRSAFAEPRNETTVDTCGTLAIGHGLSKGTFNTFVEWRRYDAHDHGGLNCTYNTLAGVAHARRLPAEDAERPIRFTSKGIRTDERVALAVGRVRTSCVGMWTCSRLHRAKLAAERKRSRWSIFLLLLGLTQVCMCVQMPDCI